MKNSIKTRLMSLFEATEKLLLPDAKKTREDMKALLALQPLSQSFLPWTGSALRPSAIRLMLNEIVIHRRKVIVEFGSGISTVFISKILKQCDARLISIDQDATWQRQVASMCQDNSEFVHFVTAPLEDTRISDIKSSWFQKRAVLDALSSLQVDCILVDAPISLPSEYTRYPALPILWPMLASDFCVFLDDIERKEEKNIAERWSAEYSLNLVLSRMVGGVGILRPKTAGRHYNIY